MLPFVLEKKEACRASVLWHNDLHSDNIFVDKDNPALITGIIDWQAVPLNPAFLHVHYPSLIEYDGPILDGFEKPKLPPKFKELSDEDQKAARALVSSQSIWLFYKVAIQQQAPDLLRVLLNRDYLPRQILSLAGSTFDDGEAYVQYILSDLAQAEMWQNILAQNKQEFVQCPLSYSTEQRAKFQSEIEKWERDVALKARVLEEVGAYNGWNGAVPPEEYDSRGAILEKAKHDFLDRESNSLAEREQWEKVWPFRDG